MKFFAFIVCTFFALQISAQQNPTPQSFKLSADYAKNEKYTMDWYMLRDTKKRSMGTIYAEMEKKGNQLISITRIKIPGLPIDWIDTTIAELPSLKPIYHSSYNGQRDMILQFRGGVSGYYFDKASGKTTLINDTSSTGFFDSNMYPQLLRWLPLAEGYTAKIPIYDFSPRKRGKLFANLTKTTEGDINGKKVWILTVSDDISDNKTIGRYFIDQKTRMLLKQEVDVNKSLMVMDLVDGK